jgi:hypothetical protein
MNLELSLEELKSLREGLSKARATSLNYGIIKKIEAILLENNLVYEFVQKPKVKYQKKAIWEYVWKEVNKVASLNN